MSVEQLLLVVLFAVVALIDFIVRRRRRRTPTAAGPSESEMPPRPLPDAVTPARPRPPRIREVVAPPEVAAAVRRAPPPRVAPRRDVGGARLGLRGRADLRRAIVLTVVLGPPAAAEVERGPGPRPSW